MKATAAVRLTKHKCKQKRRNVQNPQVSVKAGFDLYYWYTDKELNNKTMTLHKGNKELYFLCKNGRKSSPVIMSGKNRLLMFTRTNGSIIMWNMYSAIIHERNNRYDI